MRIFFAIFLSTALLLSACGNKSADPSQQNGATNVASAGKNSNPPKQIVDKAEQTKLEEQQFKESTSRIAYKDLARNPDKYKSAKVFFYGQVTQVVQEKKSDVVLRIEVTQDKFGLWDDAIWVNYSKPEGQDRILEKDIIQIWGTVKGLRTYTSAMGSEVTIPEIDTKYITLGAPSDKSDKNEPAKNMKKPESESPQQSTSSKETPVPAEAGAKADGFLYDELVRNYEDLLIGAINTGKFSIVESMLLKGSSLYDSQQKLVDSLSQKGTTEELVEYEIKDAQNDEKNKTVFLTVREVIKVKKKDGESTNEYTWIYTVKQNEQGRLQFSDIRKP